MKTLFPTLVQERREQNKTKPIREELKQMLIICAVDMDTDRLWAYAVERSAHTVQQDDVQCTSH